MKSLRPFILISALFLFSTGALGKTLAGEGAPPSLTGAGEPELLRWAVTQGGLVLVTLVVIWSYRRDFQRVFVEEKERTAALMEVLNKATAALATHTEASRQQAASFAELASSVRLCEAVRQMIHEDERG